MAKIHVSRPPPDEPPAPDPAAVRAAVTQLTAGVSAASFDAVLARGGSYWRECLGGIRRAVLIAGAGRHRAAIGAATAEVIFAALHQERPDLWRVVAGHAAGHDWLLAQIAEVKRALGV